MEEEQIKRGLLSHFLPEFNSTKGRPIADIVAERNTEQKKKEEE